MFRMPIKLLRNMGINKENSSTVNMCKGTEGIYNDGVERGIEQGIEQGRDLVNKLAILMEKDGRIDEFLASLQNADIQKQYLKEYGLI